MINFYDIAYGFGVAVSAPYWAAKPATRRKVLDAFDQRMGEVKNRESNSIAILIHAVSVGEINATVSLVQLLREKIPNLHVIISTTTKTGYARGEQLFGNAPHTTLVRYPLDFTAAVVRMLDALHPNLVVLMELEVWPNFMQLCARRKIPVILANGRLTTSSLKKYKLIKPLAAKMFRRLARVCAQDETYADRFEQLGVPREKIEITGTLKFDTAQIAHRVEGDVELATALGLPVWHGLKGRDTETSARDTGFQLVANSSTTQPLQASEPIWVCGSTGPGEEEIILQVYRNLLANFRRLRLVIVPRKPERFDEVAQLIERFKFQVIRRSRNDSPPINPPVPPVILGDTMGELRKFYSIADIVFVGRTLVDLGSRQHGSDMIEPAALGKPIIVGPFTGNFDQPMRQLRAADAILEVVDDESLEQAIRVLISTPAQTAAMGQRAQAVVRANQGATQLHASLISTTLSSIEQTTK